METQIASKRKDASPDATERLGPLISCHKYFQGRTVFCIPADMGYGVKMSLVGKGARIVYRLVEICISLMALILTLPVMLVLAIIIRLDSPGPILFFQQRCSRSKLVQGKYLRNNAHYVLSGASFADEEYYNVPQTFTFVKFRTMWHDAKEKYPELYDYYFTQDELNQIAFKREDDPRVTPVGKWLRMSTLDELPNFWNVITGDMRLVGPRPEIAEMLPNYRPEQMVKFTVKPGVTGLSQIRGRGRLGFQETVANDLEYVEKKCVLLDIKIILMTFYKVLTKHGAF